MCTIIYLKATINNCSCCLRSLLTTIEPSEQRESERNTAHTHTQTRASIANNQQTVNSSAPTFNDENIFSRSVGLTERVRACERFTQITGGLSKCSHRRLQKSTVSWMLLAVRCFLRKRSTNRNRNKKTEAQNIDLCLWLLFLFILFLIFVPFFFYFYSVSVETLISLAEIIFKY